MRLVSALIAVASCVAAIGCGLNQEGIGPPNNTIFFPGAIVVGGDRLDPTDSRWLFVVNSNSDLRYNDGTLVAVDLDQVINDRKTKLWGNCPAANYIYPSSAPPKYCCWDLLDSNVLNCDERDYVKSAIRLGSFGSAIQVQPNSPAGGNQSRLFVGVRGNASITYADVDATSGVKAPVFKCVEGNPGTFDECDTNHRVTNEPNLDNANPAPVLPDEPYALAIDPSDPQPLLYVGHLRAGFLSALDLRNTPTLIGSFGSIFPTDVNGSAGVTSITVTSTHINAGRAYATSRFLPRAGAFGPFSTSNPDLSQAVADPETSVFLGNAGDAFVSPLTGSEVRGIQIIPGINRTYLLQRTPPALVGFDTLGGQNIASDVLEVCQGPTFLHMSPPYLTTEPPYVPTTDMDKRLFVTCFEAGEVYVVDPYVPQIISIIEVGRGPAGLAFSNELPKPQYAYVVGFGANNVSIIDLADNSPTQYHVIERIGFPSPTPR